MRKYILPLAAVACATLSMPAHAAFTLATDANLVEIVENSVDATFQAGESIKTAFDGPIRGNDSGTFTSYTKDFAGPPDFVPLTQFGYGMNLNVLSTNPTATVFSGTYEIKQFRPGNEVWNVSSGTAALTLAGSMQSGGALTGTLLQTAGPSSGEAPNITYDGVFQYDGYFQPIIIQPGQELGYIVGSISSTAVPEPGSLALLGTGILPILGLIRRRK